MTETKDRPTVEERYLTANTGSEVLTAAALASIGDEREQVEIALLLWEVTYKGKSEKQTRLADLLGNRLNREKDKTKRLKGDAWKIAKEMLAWHLHGICQRCEGRGYEKIKDTPAVSPNPCGDCHGTGKRPYPRDAAYVWMASYLGALTALAAGEVMKRLRVQMEL